MESCLRLFDANCPEFFAPNERRDYEDFLNTHPATYELCIVEESVVGVFGLMGNSANYRSLNWIMLDPTSQGLGLGTAIMERVVLKARELAVQKVAIAASQKSAPFFAKFGASEQATTENGWGPGMHRVDMELAL
jgi:N-acetylglutamate synthase-like GNAT family acetyltransferase